MDWRAFETALFQSARATLEQLLAEGHGPLYAAAFNGSYREEGYIIDLPHLGANSIKALDEDHPARREEGFTGIKWNPADWRWNWSPDSYGDEALLALDKMLQAHANRDDPKAWHAAEKQFMTSVTRAATLLYRHFAGNRHVSPDFIVFFADETGGAELAKASIPPERFLKHFPELDATETLRRQLAAKPEADQAGYYVTRLGCFDGINTEEAQAWLVAHGAAALPLLVSILQSGGDVWTAARLLGLIGIRDAAAIDVMRAVMLAHEAEPARAWCARGLGYLGDHEWLLEQEDLALVAEGFTANLRAFRDRGAIPNRLDYAPLEALLARRPESAGLVEAAIRPGSGFCAIGPEDVAEALRGLASSHVAIRRHAVAILGDRSLPKRLITAEIVPALKPLAADPDEAVRRLTALALKRLKATP